MSHIALYRKYRPITFSDMVGQEHVTRVLKNQITTGKISHAYIFSGTRGTGKTSAAKIFARAINCENPQDGEPCNECEACKSILSGDSTDVVEMDAASNNSVENIRAIRQEVMYVSTQVKYKVYIIDEAHMLSTSAFNALLKTLEEPPEHVVFILATTEEHKILPTILSRCIRFEFKKLTNDEIVSRLKQVLSEYNVKYEENALKLIASLADGAMRDALSILERCINSDNNTLTESFVREIVGIVQIELIQELLAGVLEYDVPKTKDAVERLLDKGKDLRYCLSQLIIQTMNLVMYKSGDTTTNLCDMLKDVSQDIPMLRLNVILKRLAKLDDDLRQTTNPTVIFEACMLELATDIKLNEKQDVIDLIKALEVKIDSTDRKTVIVEKEVIKEQVPFANSEVREEKSVAESPKAEPTAKMFKLLPKVIDKAAEADLPMLYSALSGIKAFQKGECINFVTDNSFSYDVLKKEELRQELTDIVNEVSGKDFEITIDLNKAEEKNEAAAFEKMFIGTDVPFTKID